jgi:RNA polymerase subunit RPABC4/transcription elongation factor Spt4
MNVQVFCNYCGFASHEDDEVCTVCGHSLVQDPPLADITSGRILVCEDCGALNRENIEYCRQCGKRMEITVLQEAVGVAVERVSAAASMSSAAELERSDARDSGEGSKAEMIGVSGESGYVDLPRALEAEPAPGESLLEKLDRMERELATLKVEVTPETVAAGTDDLDEREETLNNISYTLDSLIADLLEAEVREYAFPDFLHPDETGFPLKERAAPKPKTPEKRRSFQEVLVMTALIAAIFLVGLTFGLWGSYFFGF